MHDQGETNLSSNGLRLQAKLTLAFVLVGLVGFLLAFQLLPRLILRSWTEEFEAAKGPNAQQLRNRYVAELLASPQPESLRGIADQIVQSSGFDLDGLEIPDLPMDPKAFLSLLSRKNGPEQIEGVRSWFQFLEDRYEFVRIIPYEVPPISEKIHLFHKIIGEGSSEYFLPIMASLSSPDNEFNGVLAVGGSRKVDPLSVTPSSLSSEFSAISMRIANPEEIDFFPAPLIHETNPALYKKALVEKENPYWQERVEGSDTVYQFIPVLDIDKAPFEEGRLLGLFFITYRPPEGVFAWTELASGEGYIAIGVAALFALICSYFFAKGITRPIKTLTSSVTAFADGRLDEPVVVKSRDEIGILAGTFNEMRQRLQTNLKQLRERAKTIESQKEELDEQFKSLQILQNYTENVLASVDSAIFSVDPSGEVRSPNRAAQSLLGLEEGNQIDDSLSETLAERLRTALDIGETTLSEEMNVESPSKEVVPVAVSVTPLKEGGTIIGAVAVLTDLSVIKNLEATVSRQERLAALGQLTAGVAHEVRNPLSIIKACAEILQQNFQGQPGENGLCNDIIEEADRLSRVVTEFLTFARPSEPDRAPLDLNETLNRTIDRIEVSNPEDVIIERDFDPTIPEVEADSDQLEQVLLNLIRNGIEAMDGAGKVVVRSGAEKGDGSVWIEVMDNGAGMDDETRRRVFDPFFTSKAEGTGLGLSICHRILESHGGRIEVRDSKPGVGTTFRMTLPVREREPVG
ncbi:MAG: HAMP domain-containing protein [Candidatus Omnitrophica bacterium]|nr:HAMP domain-containing protein [Candidatus Omnitrophota bacterium]MCA9446705.1 HAMP domain-containing protein [Candidatus Omnitrophota bacterium]MCB9768260.1 HAMP domain-containing protein [Candidatus Omnitrophota bacterium]